jgi:hypothetical protein
MNKKYTNTQTERVCTNVQMIQLIALRSRHRHYPDNLYVLQFLTFATCSQVGRKKVVVVKIGTEKQFISCDAEIYIILTKK